MSDAKVPLHDLLSNTIVLRQLMPYLPIVSFLNLTSTSKTVRDVLLREPDAFRYLNLSSVKRAAIKNNAPVDSGGVNWRSQRMDEALTQDEFVSGPLRGIFSKLERRNVLKDVQTLILDGLGVTAELVDEIISQDRFNVRMLSIRGCQLNEGKLMQVLKYAARPTRPEGMPRLKALYFFGQKDGRAIGNSARMALINPAEGAQTQTPGVMGSEGAQLGSSYNTRSQDALNASLSRCEDRWYHPMGRLTTLKSCVAKAWAETIYDCEGIIAFDVVLCRGPRHDAAQILNGNQDIQTQQHLPAQVANVALGAGCVKCGTMPEGPAIFGSSPSTHLPILEPPPLHTSAVRQAQKPHLVEPTDGAYPPLFIRCEECLRGRWCERCLKWWCEDCYHPESAGKRLDEVSVSSIASHFPDVTCDSGLKVHPYLGLCTEDCLVGEMMSGAGSFGMWG